MGKTIGFSFLVSGLAMGTKTGVVPGKAAGGTGSYVSPWTTDSGRPACASYVWLMSPRWMLVWTICAFWLRSLESLSGSLALYHLVTPQIRNSSRKKPAMPTPTYSPFLTKNCLTSTLDFVFALAIALLPAGAG